MTNPLDFGLGHRLRLPGHEKPGLLQGFYRLVPGGGYPNAMQRFLRGPKRPSWSYAACEPDHPELAALAVGMFGSRIMVRPWITVWAGPPRADEASDVRTMRNAFAGKIAGDADAICALDSLRHPNAFPGIRPNTAHDALRAAAWLRACREAASA